jgi:hypothetical protein
MRQSTRPIKLKNKNFFLNRNLSFNILKSKRNDPDYIEEYYLHIMSKGMTKREMNEYIIQYKKNRSKITNDDSILFISRNNFNQTDFKFDDEDYYIGFLGCLICKEEFKTFMSLFFHMKISHDEAYQFYHSQYKNPDTKLKESHIIIFKKPSLVNHYEDKYESIFYMKNKIAIKDLLLKLSLKFDISDKTYKEDTNKSSQTLPLNKNEKKVIKKYEDNNAGNKRIYYHSVTGGILHSDSEDSDYEIIEEDRQQLENKNIDNYSDICIEDKKFFKKWNGYISRNK